MESTVSHTTLFIQGIPASCSNDQLNEIFSVVGPIKKCFVVKGKSATETDVSKTKFIGFVSYETAEDAKSAVNSPAGKFAVEGKSVKVCFAKKKKFSKTSQKKNEQKKEKSEVVSDNDSDTNNIDETSLKKKKRKNKISVKNDCIVEISGMPKSYTTDSVNDLFKKKKLSVPKNTILHSSDPTLFHCVMPNKQAALKVISVLSGKEIQEQMIKVVLVMDKESKDFRKSSKRSRLIIRNLSFNCSENDLRSVFEKFGSITDLNIPKKSNGKKLGFGFVQYTHIFEAQKAVEEVNMTAIKGRKVAVDYALPREKFKEISKKEESDKEPQSDAHKLDDDSNVDDIDENSGVEDEDSGMESDDERSDGEESGKESGEEQDEESSSGEEEDGKEPKKSTLKPVEPKQRDKDFSSDVHEGKTVFLRNLSFDTQEEDLSEEMENFGPLKYCKVVINKANGLSKGCAFVQFLNLEDAQSCLTTLNNETTKLKVDGRELLATVAMSRPDARKIVKEEKEQKNEKEDKRNLHLANEGLVRAGTQPAIGLSEVELNKRRKIDEAKRLKLKNPNIFVSTTRLCVHNIPRAYDDKMIREVFLKSVKGCKITEARVMRDRDKVNQQGVARSLGFGFVNFSRHQEALAGLRAINNNPEVFGATKRPIVEFSLENKMALASQKQRRKRQVARNQLQKKMRGEAPESGRKARWEKKRKMREEKEKSGKETKQGKKKQKKPAENPGDSPEARSAFQGSTGTTSSGKKLRMPKHLGPKIRQRSKGAVLAQLRQSKKLNKKQAPPSGSRSARKAAASVAREPRKRGSESKEEAEFSSLVAKYKRKIEMGGAGEIVGGVGAKRRKWFH